MAAKIAIHNVLRRGVPLLLLSGLTLMGCSGDTTGPAAIAPAQLYGALRFNWKAVTMALAAPYDTVQLTATPMNALGDPITSDTPVQYTVADSNVTVSATGLVTAHYLTGSTQVIATLTMNGLTHKDTATIEVTPTPFAAPFATLSIQPQPDGLDSAQISLTWASSINQYNGNIPVYATIATGNPATDTVCDVNNYGCPFLVAFQSSDPTVAKLDQYGDLLANRVGRVTFYASAYVYGVGKRDSLPFTIEYRTSVGINLRPSGSLSNPVPYVDGSGSIVGVGGQIGLYNDFTTDSIVVVLPYQTPKIRRLYVSSNLTFQMTDTIPPPGHGSNNVAFRFDSAGTYTFHAMVLHGSGQTVDGTINVQSGP